jgi:hypothetical protein
MWLCLPAGTHAGRQPATPPLSLAGATVAVRGPIGLR